MTKNTTSGFIPFDHGKLAYQVYGNGNKVILAFHGFGQDKSVMRKLSSELGESCKVYSFDLPYHGESLWKECEDNISKGDIKSAFESWLGQENIKSFSVYGYSMGGKFALSLAETLPEKTNYLFMAAADGLYKSPWTSLLISWPVRLLFKRTIDKPTFFFGMARFIKSLRIIPDKLLDFGVSQMATRELRAMVYYTWRNFKELYIDTPLLRKLAKDDKLQVYVMLGKKDGVINPNKIVPAIKNTGAIVELLDAGHAKSLEISFGRISEILQQISE